MGKAGACVKAFWLSWERVGDGWMQGTAVGCQRPRRGLGKVAEDAGITRSHPHSFHTTKGPASANGWEAAVRG